MIYNTNHLKKLCHCEMGNEIIKYLFLFRTLAVKSTATLHMSDFIKTFDTGYSARWGFPHILIRPFKA
jgi:hypothetical protein